MGGYLAQSESIAGSELRMAHLFIQKYMNNSLILNIQISDTYLFYAHAIYFLTSLKNTSFLFLVTVTMNSIFVVGKLEEIVLILFLFSNLKHFVRF